MAQWLSYYDLGSLAPSFQKNGIRGNVLPKLATDTSMLDELGVTSRVQRAKLLTEIESLTRVASGSYLHASTFMASTI